VLHRLAGVTDGTLVLRDADGSHAFGVATAHAPAATIDVHDGRFFRALATRGNLGAAESYMRGDWDCDDLVALVRLVCRNAALSGAPRGLTGRLEGLLKTFAHRLRRNTRGGSRRNIHEHYDLGNEFFATFLDASMTYSCAVFDRADDTLEDAQFNKFDRLCRRLDLSPADHLLEIGCGWGGFALHAAGRYGCRVTATTISTEQFAFARQRVREAGLGARIEILQCDYRDLRGTFDKLASIEMIEAVGHEYLDAYFATCSRLLRPNGLMALQGITITDQEYDQYRRSVDFIRRHVFPGGCVPSVAAIAAATARSTDFRLLQFEDLGPHYARTLAEWRRRFDRQRAALRARGRSERFLRLWQFYLCYCEGGFHERQIGLGQWLFARPGNRRELVPS
jgi:cyclopropane-fatty-acyl-phospholipid synthase